MLPFLIYIGTIAYIPHWIFILAIVWAICRDEKIRKSDFSNFQFLIIVLIVLLSGANFFFHEIFSTYDQELVPYTFLMLGSYIIAKRLSPEELKILIYLIAAECFFAYAEFALGIKTFFTGLQDNVQNSDTSLLYYRSVFGLSDNSSSFAVKLMVAYLSIFFLNLKGKWITIIKILLLIALVISFNRTAMMVVVLFHVLNFILLFKNSIVEFLQMRIKTGLLLALIGSACIFLALTYLAVVNYELISEQLTRRTQGIDITGRNWIWVDFSSFISDHWLLGNGSHKFFLLKDGEQYHAHNSFLQTFANQGLIIGALFVLLVLSGRRGSFIYVFVIILYSMFQYGVFWGISMLDISLLFFIMHKKAT